MDDRLMQELKLHGEAMSADGSQSPLLQIREKELEIRGRVMEAQKKADQIISDARGRGAKLVEEAQQRAEREAAAVHEKGRAEIDTDVEKLVEEQEDATVKMIKEARGRVDKAVELVLDRAIP